MSEPLKATVTFTVPEHRTVSFPGKSDIVPYTPVSLILCESNICYAKEKYNIMLETDIIEEICSLSKSLQNTFIDIKRHWNPEYGYVSVDSLNRSPTYRVNVPELIKRGFVKRVSIETFRKTFPEISFEIQGRLLLINPHLLKCAGNQGKLEHLWRTIS